MSKASRLLRLVQYFTKSGTKVTRKMKLRPGSKAFAKSKPVGGAKKTATKVKAPSKASIRKKEAAIQSKSKVVKKPATKKTPAKKKAPTAAQIRKQIDKTKRLNSKMMKDANGISSKKRSLVKKSAPTKATTAKKKPVPAKTTTASHVKDLKLSGTVGSKSSEISRAKFDKAFAALKSDKTMKKADLDKIAKSYTGYSITYKTKAKAFDAIRNKFTETANSASRLNYIGKTTPW